MFVVTPIHKSVNNVDTGIDISVPTVLEIEAPLGGTSIEYEIFIVTNLPAFKSQIHKDEEVIQFSVQKAYREMEAFHEKIRKKHSNIDLYAIPKGRSSTQQTSEEKRKHLDKFVNDIAKNKEISHSVLFNQFVGIDKLKHGKSKDTNQKSLEDAASSNLSEIKEPLPKGNNSTEAEPIDSMEGIVKLFPKVKVRKSSKSDPLSFLESDNPLNNTSVNNRNDLSDEDEDLFEAARHDNKPAKIKERQLKTQSTVKDTLIPKAEENADLFRINSPTPANHVPEVIKISPTLPPRTLISDEDPIERPKELDLFEVPATSEKEKDDLFEQQKNSQNEDILRGDNFTERKFGNVFLFEEQDLDYGGITKEDEQLFFIPKGESKKSKANPFLSPSSESTDDEDVDESILEELTTLANQSSSSVPELEKSLAELNRQVKPKPPPKKPVLTPSNEELPKKPQIAPKPSVPTTKPNLPPKPKPAPKPMKKPSATSSKARVEDKKDLNPIDIMQYIEQEQKSLAADVSLFD